MSTPMVYLENSVENAAALPPELSRLLALVKNLDERVEDLRERQRVNYKRCCNYPPQHNLLPTDPLYQEIEQFRGQLIKQDVHQVQWAEEKLSLCCIARDLLKQHITQLDADLQGLETELEGVSYDMDDDCDHMMLAEQERQERQLALETEAEEREAKRREEEARRLNLQTQSGMSDGALGRNLSGFGGEGFGATVTETTHQDPDLYAGRRNDREGPASRPEVNSKQNAAQAAVNAAAQAMAQEDGIEDGGFGAGDGGGPAPYMPVLPPGMQTSAPKPQAPGRLLTYADINESLRGRRAELFWPDDNLWYLIEIHDLDLDNNKAQIMYITGETEELQLAEIVQDGHMQLISTSSL